MKDKPAGVGALHVNQLLLVDALATSGNLSEAAEQIGMSQSAASHALARLRTQLMDPIFIRTSEGMQATPFGFRFARSVSNALQMLRTGIARSSDFAPETSGRTFNIIMSDVSQTLYLPRLLARLQLEAPNASLCIAPIPSKSPHLILESGDVDLAVGAFTRFIAGCRQKRLYRERYVCIAREEHSRFDEGMTTEAFSSVPHVVVDAKGFVHEQLDSILKEHNVPRSHKLRVPGFQSVPLVVANSDLVAVMAGRLASLYATLLPLKIMAPPVALPSYDIKLFWHERFHRDPTSLWLRRLFVELFAD